MAITKKLRFEVFKRDSFTCQYCGAKAPDVVLQVDHIEPASKGGADTILNLITSCTACNAGKSDRRLSDDSVVAKQRDQLAALQERQEQIQMMLDWQRSLVSLDAQSIDALAQLWNELAVSTTVNEVGRKTLGKLLRKYGFEMVAQAIRIATDKYLIVDADGDVEESSAEVAFAKIKGICAVTSASVEKPYLRDLFYIRGILRNRDAQGDIRVSNLRNETELVEAAFALGGNADVLKGFARNASSWANWRNELDDYIKELRRSAAKS